MKIGHIAELLLHNQFKLVYFTAYAIDEYTTFTTDDLRGWNDRVHIGGGHYGRVHECQYIANHLVAVKTCKLVTR